MTKFFTRMVRFIQARYAPRGAKVTFAAAGEDIVVNDILKKLGVKKPFYIDIGVHHPIFGNNTYLFYRQRGRGVLVEPNEVLANLCERKRPRDVCVNAGVGKKDQETDFYLFEQSTRSTFSERQAREWEEVSGQKPKILRQKVFSLDTLIKEYGNGKIPDFISIDAEGIDLDILRGFSFDVRPKVFCIEMSAGIKELMESRNYGLGASIFQNSIFVDNFTKLQ